MKAGIICIGNEILLGKTINTNLAFIAKHFSHIGIDIVESIVIKDERDAILSSLEHYWNTFDIVLVTGGLGPTTDDITKQTLTDFFGKQLVFSSTVWDRVQKIFADRNMVTPLINRNQALVPSDFVALQNNFGTAPGLCYRDGEKMFFALPGVPIEMKYLITSKIITILEKRYKLEPIKITTIHTWNITESKLAELLENIEIPNEASLAYLPQTGRVDVRVYGNNEVQNLKLLNQIREILKPYIWGENNSSPAEAIHKLFLENKATLTFAESCTGGLVQESITSFSGSSSYFLGGIVSYANEIKENVLKVSSETLATQGAVSEETAIEMVNGVAKLMNADYAGSITGIAGPGGGTKEKPVGTVYIAVKTPDKIVTKLLKLKGDRDSIRLKAAEQLLLLLLANC